MSPYDMNQNNLQNAVMPNQISWDPYRTPQNQTMTAGPTQPRQMYQPIVYDQVQGKVVATIYPLYVNQEARLFDIEQPLMYVVKNKDGKRLPVETYRLTKVSDEEVQQQDMSQFVKMDDILDLITDTVKTEVDKKLSEISFKPSKEKE
ncbi:MAG: hypothetical protein J6U54_09620 [Clostridiales bacterium]|nr:hypothetical protein [Clostridiales bacterium]